MVKLVFTNEWANVLLFLYGLFLLLFIYARKRKKKRALKFGNYNTLKKIAGKHFIESNKLLFLIHLLAITSLVIGLSSPVIVDRRPSASSDYVLAIDTSPSMFIDDISPSRFQAAKDVSSQFIDQLGNSSQAGIISFAGKVTQETDGLVDAPTTVPAINRLTQGQTPGTAIGDALITGTNMLAGSNRTRRLMLITDGANNKGASINESIQFANRNNVSVYAVGIGQSTNASNITRTVEIDGENVTQASYPNLDTAELTRLTYNTGGNVSFITNRSSFETAIISMTHTKQTTDLTTAFIFIGVLLLLLDWVFKTTKYTSLP